jgi:hypothetical protein
MVSTSRGLALLALLLALLHALGCAATIAGPGSGEDPAGEDAGAADAGTVVDPRPAALRFATDLRAEPSFRTASSHVVFRYRAYLGVRPAAVSPGTSSIGLVTATSRGGAGIDDLLAAQLDGANHGFIGAAPLAAATGLTIDAWFRTERHGARQVLFSNLGPGGVALRLGPAGKLEGVVHTSEDGAAVAHAIVAPGDAADGLWHHASLRVRSTAGLELRLYLDGRLVAEEIGATDAPLLASAALPAVGGQAAAGALVADGFAGELTAVEVRDWAVAHDVLASPWFDDGSTYRGRPDYHESFAAGDDLVARIEVTSDTHPDVLTARGLFGQAFLGDRYVTTGLARSDDPALGSRIFFSAYYWDERGADGTQGERNPERFPTLIVEADLAERRVVRVYRLPLVPERYLAGEQTVKAGGITIFRGSFYVPVGNGVFRLPIAKAHPVGRSDVVGGYEIVEFDPADQAAFDTRSAGHFVDVDARTGALWIGQWQPPGSIGRLDRYQLALDGPTAGDPTTVEPVERLNLPVDYVQGAVRSGTLERPTFLLSRASSTISMLIRWDLSVADDPATPVREDVQVLARMPRAFEDLDQDADGTIFVGNENGTMVQQLRVGLAELHPYIAMFYEPDL